MLHESLQAPRDLDTPLRQRFDGQRIALATRDVAMDLFRPQKLDQKMKRLAEAVAALSVRQAYHALAAMHGRPCGLRHHNQSAGGNGDVCPAAAREANWMCAHGEQIHVIRGLVIGELEKIGMEDLLARYRATRPHQRRTLAGADEHGAIAYHIVNGPMNPKRGNLGKRLSNAALRALGVRRTEIETLTPADIERWAQQVQIVSAEPVGEIICELKERMELWEPGLKARTELPVVD